MFWLRFVRLLLSVAAEGVYNAAGFLFFPLRRRRVRARMLSVMCEGRSEPSRAPGRAAVAALALGALVVGGCAPFPGASFEKQIENTEWTIVQLADQSGWQDSLVEDLENLTDPEWDQLPETFTMLGW